MSIGVTLMPLKGQVWTQHLQYKPSFSLPFANYGNLYHG